MAKHQRRGVKRQRRSVASAKLKWQRWRGMAWRNQRNIKRISVSVALRKPAGALIWRNNALQHRATKARNSVFINGSMAWRGVAAASIISISDSGSKMAAWRKQRQWRISRA
jgi:hypothetical protein